MTRFLFALPILALLCANFACKPSPETGSLPPPSATRLVSAALSPDNSFNDYWYAGKAELNRYDLSQARYGELRQGEAVLIFVTEDFLAQKQVKLESAPKPEATSVLKLNFLKSFPTGLYDYSTMTSVFTPIDLAKFPHTLKTTTSVQDWCGHVWLQLNLRGDSFMLNGYSYFEREADEHFKLPAVWLEDELWTRLRLNPSALPLGALNIIPSAVSSRLRHIKPAPELASASIVDLDDRAARYTLKLTKTDRTLSIDYEKKFPFKILGWEETYLDGFGLKATRLTTKAVLKETLITDYWTKNTVADSSLRRAFGLKP